VILENEPLLPLAEADKEPMRRRLPGKRCNDCDSVIHAKAEICPKCWVRQLLLPEAALVNHASQAECWPAPKFRVVAALLALFLGAMGLHAFYLEERKQGCVHLAAAGGAFTAYVSSFLLAASGSVESAFFLGLGGFAALALLFLAGLVGAVRILWMTEAAFHARFNLSAPNGVGA
jgi:hypothetical protein